MSRTRSRAGITSPASLRMAQLPSWQSTWPTRAGFWRGGVVIGEPQRAFYGNQYSLMMPVFAHYGVELWVPEVGGPIDPDSEAHDLIMSVFGGLSQADRHRIPLRRPTATSPH